MKNYKVKIKAKDMEIEAINEVEALEKVIDLVKKCINSKIGINKITTKESIFEYDVIELKTSSNLSK